VLLQAQAGGLMVDGAIESMAGGVRLLSRDGRITVHGQVSAWDDVVMGSSESTEAVQAGIHIAANIVSSSGDIVVLAADEVEQLSDASDMQALANGAQIHVVAQDGIRMVGSAQVRAAEITYVTHEGDLEVGTLVSGSGSVTVLADNGSVLNAQNKLGINVQAVQVVLHAAENLGASGHPMDIEAAQVFAGAGAEMHLTQGGAPVVLPAPSVNDPALQAAITQAHEDVQKLLVQLAAWQAAPSALSQSFLLGYPALQPAAAGVMLTGGDAFFYQSEPGEQALTL